MKMFEYAGPVALAMTAALAIVSSASAQTQFGASDDPSYCEVWSALSNEPNDRCPDAGSAAAQSGEGGLSLSGTTQGLSIRQAPADAAAPAPSPATPAAAATTAPAEPAAPAAPVVPAATPATAPSAPVVRAASFGSIQFELNSAQLTPRAMETLDTIADVLADPGLAGNSFVIEGHTDASGSATYNQSLSEQRARAVVDYLTSQAGIDDSRLQPEGKGETQPLPGLAPTAGDNRRVVVLNTGT
ncbi:OmpA family protein [Inquilinus sp. CAU 1745]|uniref:OmpA family protein n=1 Tax=Inquilinus sp. CAU 1745 TaxID=3140369 RepID=UPI00325AD2F4